MKRYHFFYGVTISCLLLFNVILFFYSRFLQATVSSVVTTETNDGYMNDCCSANIPLFKIRRENIE